MSESAKSSSRIEVGRVGRAQGLRGEVRVQLYNPDSTLLEHASSVSLGPEPSPRDVAIRSVRKAGKHWIVLFDGCRNRGEAEALAGSLIFVGRDAFPEAEEGEYYDVDLVGLEVRNTDETVIGFVEAVLHYPTTECLQVCCTDAPEGQELMEVPFREPFLLEVSLSEGWIRIDLFEEIPRYVRSKKQ